MPLLITSDSESSGVTLLVLLKYDAAVSSCFNHQDVPSKLILPEALTVDRLVPQEQ